MKAKEIVHKDYTLVDKVFPILKPLYKYPESYQVDGGWLEPSLTRSGSLQRSKRRRLEWSAWEWITVGDISVN